MVWTSLQAWIVRVYAKGLVSSLPIFRELLISTRNLCYSSLSSTLSSNDNLIDLLINGFFCTGNETTLFPRETRDFNVAAVVLHFNKHEWCYCQQHACHGNKIDIATAVVNFFFPIYGCLDWMHSFMFVSSAWCVNSGWI